jgi:predicted acetyltransferase
MAGMRCCVALEIRPLKPDEMKQFEENLRIAFSAPPRPRDEPERPQEFLPEWTLCAFEDGKLATTYAAFPLTLYMNGKTAAAAGVSAVSTLPWYRRRGHLRRIMEHDFARMHEQGGPALAVLYASMAAIYQRFGYSVVSTHLRYTVEPQHITFTHPAPPRGRMRALARNDLSSVIPVYERFAAERTGYIRRADHEWQHMAIGYGPEQPLMAAYEEDGETLGYLIYFAENKQREAFQLGGTVIVYVGELVWLTPSAYQALWGYIRQVDLARQIIFYRLPIDDPAKDLFLEPRLLHALEIDGVLARIVDVDRALSERGYDAEGEVTFEVQDEMAPWNSGRWEMETGGGQTCVRRTDRTPELTVPIGTLASLLFGHFTASHAARIGRLAVHDPAALSRWDTLFRTKFPPACGNGF